jgi:hypothetical protein
MRHGGTLKAGNIPFAARDCPDRKMAYCPTPALAIASDRLRACHADDGAASRR